MAVSLSVFALAAVLITGYERVSGQPLSGGTGTTVSQVGNDTSAGSGKGTKTTPSSTPTPSGTPSASASKPAASTSPAVGTAPSAPESAQTPSPSASESAPEATPTPSAGIDGAPGVGTGN